MQLDILAVCQPYGSLSVRIFGVFLGYVIHKIILLPVQRPAPRYTDADHIDPIFIPGGLLIAVEFEVNTVGLGQLFGFPGNVIAVQVGKISAQVPCDRAGTDFIELFLGEFLRGRIKIGRAGFSVHGFLSKFKWNYYLSRGTRNVNGIF